MKTKSRLFFSLFLTTFCSPAFAAENLEAAQKILQDALTELTQAEGGDRWSESSSRLDQTLDELLSSPSLGLDSACDALLPLSPEELTSFESAIDRHPRSKRLPCLPELKNRLDDHWAYVSASVRSRVASSPTTLEIRDQIVDPARGETYFRADLADDEVALTFDDGPHPTRTLEILDTLDSFGVKATYFQIGNNAKANPHLVREALRRGHTVASHTVSHPNLPRLSLEAAQREILGGHAAVVAAAGDAGEIPYFFRFPYGARSKTLSTWVSDQGIASFLWNMDTLDWKITDVDTLLANVRSELNAQKGGIMLFHDVHRQSAAVMPLVLDEFRVRGIRCVRFVTATPQR